MHYVSTRNNTKSYTFQRVLFDGFAPDGGLFVPKQLPKVNWKSWKNKPYQFVVGEILKSFIGDAELPLQEMLDRVYSRENFDDTQIAPLKKLNDELYVLELFHGPTWSFKDYALLMVGELLEHYLRKANKRLCLLVATSGDTGSSAIEAVKNRSNMDIVVLFPLNRVTNIQQLQMTTVKAANVHVIAVDGSSDEMDVVIREIVQDHQFAQHHHLGSVNSINWARIAIQIAHWFYVYLQLNDDDDYTELLNVAVPVGAAGNLTVLAGLYAKRMGLPINMLACTNKNEVVHHWIQTGLLQSTDAKQSLAVAMDIQVPYNVERLVYLLTDGGDMFVKQYMQQFYDTNAAQLPNVLMQKVDDTFLSCSVDDEKIKETMKSVYQKYSYYVCPHTATSIFSAASLLENSRCVCISTAAPYKFKEAFEDCEIAIDKHPRVTSLTALTPISFPVWKKGEHWVHLLKKKIDEITEKYERNH